MAIGFDQPIESISEEDLRAQLSLLRSERKARAKVRREAHRKRTIESSELDVMLRMLPKEAHGELEAMIAKYKEAQE